MNRRSSELAAKVAQELRESRGSGDSTLARTYAQKTLDLIRDVLGDPQKADCHASGLPGFPKFLQGLAAIMSGHPRQAPKHRAFVMKMLNDPNLVDAVVALSQKEPESVPSEIQRIAMAISGAQAALNSIPKGEQYANRMLAHD